MMSLVLKRLVTAFLPINSFLVFAPRMSGPAGRSEQRCVVEWREEPEPGRAGRHGGGGAFAEERVEGACYGTERRPGRGQAAREHPEPTHAHR